MFVASPLLVGVEAAGQVAVVAGTIVLLLMLTALGGFAYKQLRGDGVRWPDEMEDEESDGVRQGSDDDEWKFY